MKNVIVMLSASVASGLLLANIYTSVVDAKSWGADIPHSIAAAREYFKVVNPGNFFRIFSPVNQLLALLALIICWKTVPSVRVHLGIALAFYLISEALTFGYFYPRNDIMFRTASLTDTETLKKVWNEWNTMNWVRSAVLAVGILFSYISLHRMYSK